MRQNLRTTPNNSSRQHPTKSAKSATRIRLTLDSFVPSSRTITRTISDHKQQRGKTIQVPASMMVLHHHAGVPVGRARPRDHHLGVNLDTHEDLLSLLQSNVSPGQFDLSQSRWPLSLLPHNQIEHRAGGSYFRMSPAFKPATSQSALACGGAVLFINGYKQDGFCGVLAGAFVGIAAEILLYRRKLSSLMRQDANSHSQMMRRPLASELSVTAGAYGTFRDSCHSTRGAWGGRLSFGTGAIRDSTTCKILAGVRLCDRLRGDY
jgi:hypothetical protein